MGILTDRLKENAASEKYPFHMPGHKRKVSFTENIYGYDITEVTGFDDLHNPEDIIDKLQKRIAGVYGADDAFVMVNGSTGGILTAICAAVKENEYILMARNSHKSAYNGVILAKAKTEYIYPQINKKNGITGAITLNQVENALQKNHLIKAVFITSPTYEGNIADIKEIAKAVHKYGAVLIVDAAHGAHLGINRCFCENPVELGADIVIMSTHKTLPAFTQTAIMCVNEGRIEMDRIKKYFDIFLTSSPSYLLMSSIEKCYDIIEEQGESLCRKYSENLKKFREKCTEFKNLYLYSPHQTYDFGKIVICTDKTQISGRELADILREKYNIETEMHSKNYVLAMTSFMDTEDGFERLFDALKEIDRETEACEIFNEYIGTEPIKKYEAWQLDDSECEYVHINSCHGRICAEYVYVYPPGIPWLVPGEVIDASFAAKVEAFEQNGIQVRGISDKKLKVLKME